MRAHWRQWLAAGACVLAAAACCVVASGAPAGGGGPDTPGQLEVNLVSAPMAVAAGQGIWFSWAGNDARAGESQRGYELRVAASPAGLGSAAAAVWDSGTVTSPGPGAAYAGRALRGGTRYWWTVRTLDAQGRPGPWAAPAEFGTALGATWQAAPVWARPPKGGTSSGWAFLRGTVAIGRQPVVAATVYATGTSTVPARQYVFRLSVNGTVLGTGPARTADPASTEYSAWDVTSALHAGANAFGALAFSAASPAFQLELVVQYSGGKRQVWGTGPNWQGLDGGGAYPAAGSISPRGYDAPVENLDAERYPFGFDTPGFRPAAAAGWAPAVTRPRLAGLTPDPAATDRLTAHEPAKITALGPGRYLLDFGTTQVGGLRLTLDGTAGEKVRILSGEVLSGPDTVRYRLSTGDVYDDTWTLRAGRQTLQYWGYRVFRYVEVSGVPQPLTDANTAALALVYPDQPGRSAMTTSSAPLNEVWQFSKNTVEALNLDLYLDSPTRERAGYYEGDEYIHQLAQAAVDGDSALAQYSLRYAVTFMVLARNYMPIEYQELAPVAALAQWWQTGDPATVTALYPELRQLLPTRYLAPDGLVDLPVSPFGGSHRVPGVPEQLADWPPTEEDGFVYSPQNTVVNAFAYAAYAAMAQLAAVAGDPAGAEDDAATAERIQSAMRAKLYDPATGAFRDGAGTAHEALESSVYAVALGAASPAQAKTAAAYIARRGMACSVYCAAYLLQALYDGGQAQAALGLLTADTDTSWRHMIALGAGSTMEAWTPAVKFNLTYSHPWAASPAFIVPRDVFGVQPLAPGWAAVLIRPQPAGLASGSAEVPTPRGGVSVAFTSAPPASRGAASDGAASDRGRFTAEIDIPATATAQVALPGVRAGQRVWVDGAPVTARALPVVTGPAVTGPAGAGQGAGLAAVPVGSGWHRVSTAP